MCLEDLSLSLQNKRIGLEAIDSKQSVKLTKKKTAPWSEIGEVFIKTEYDAYSYSYLFQ